MPSETMKRAIIASRSVKPKWRARSACIESVLGNVEAAVERGGDDVVATLAVAIDRCAEGRDLAAREHHHLRLRILDLLRVEVWQQRHVATVEREHEIQLRREGTLLEHLIVGDLGPLERLVVV